MEDNFNLIYTLYAINGKVNGKPIFYNRYYKSIAMEDFIKWSITQQIKRNFGNDAIIEDLRIEKVNIKTGYAHLKDN